MHTSVHINSNKVGFVLYPAQAVWPTLSCQAVTAMGFSAIQLLFYSSNTHLCTEMLEEMDMQSISTASAFSGLMLRTLKGFRFQWVYAGATFCSLVPIFPCPVQGDNRVYRLAARVLTCICFTSQPAVRDGRWTLSQGFGLSFKSSRNLLNLSYKRVINDWWI